MISVLIPTRGQPNVLHRCIRNLREFALNDTQIEFVIRCDTDDPSTMLAVATALQTNLLPAGQTKLIVGPRYEGWASNHIFYNEAAAVASGEWLFLFNDDAWVDTRDWDDKIMRAPKRKVLATQMWKVGTSKPHVWKGEGRTFENMFPVLHRDLYEAMGHFAMHRHADVYVEWLLKPLGVQVPVEIVVMHTPSTSVRKSTWRDSLVRDADFKLAMEATAARVQEMLS